MSEYWYCVDPKDCMCGGDTRTVRQTCSNYRSLRVDLDPTRVLNPALMPVGHTPRVGEEQSTLRDQFAMAALTGLIAKGGFYPSLAIMAYQIAGEMMRERAK